jgi:hypothetical protein
MLHLHECAEPAPAESAVEESAIEPLHSINDHAAAESTTEPLQSIADSDVAADALTETSYS